MHVRVYEPRREEAALGVDRLGGVGPLAGGVDAGDQRTNDPDVSGP
jgi:hypothetical protein